MTDLRILVKRKNSNSLSGTRRIEDIAHFPDNEGKISAGRGAYCEEKNTHSGSASTTIQDTSRISIVRKLPTFNTAKLTVRQLSPIEGKYTV